MSLHEVDAAPLVVVGDCLLDVDINGRASRLCPDEPAPVLEDISQNSRPGGAGLAALLCAQMRPTILVTALGRDAAGRELRSMLESHVTVVDLGAEQTVVKTRIRAGGRTVARLDQVHHGQGQALPPSRTIVDIAAAVLVSDYGLGITAREEVRTLLTEDVPIVWDPHPRGSAPTPGVTTVTPNVPEAKLFSGAQDPYAAARVLLERWRPASVTVTCGADGAVLARPSGTPLVVPAPTVAVTDACGAGDAFAATLTNALADQADLADAVQAAVTGAASFLSGGGVGGLGEAATETTDEGQDVVAAVRARGGRVVMAGGCFDLLHAGHVQYLEAARGLGDCLVVALNSDDSVRRLKGAGRPVVSEQDRARVLRGLRCVDAVVVFDESTPSRVLQDLRPDVFAKGGDYQRSTIPEADLVRAYGGEVVVLPTLAGRSSSRLVDAAARVPIEEEQCRTQPA